eukprot:TRINITY_DN17153_c0_g1_i3.p2 TRINITY_DN17153_c0_g1~~TRINITY_DN17153_c0_g1_i3.p2  ORF type:complete len:164 (-),score=46.55 TRINITY_DN17153_c0_g1_i3:78-569(-)
MLTVGWQLKRLAQLTTWVDEELVEATTEEARVVQAEDLNLNSNAGFEAQVDLETGMQAAMGESSQTAHSSEAFERDLDCVAGSAHTTHPLTTALAPTGVSSVVVTEESSVAGPVMALDQSKVDLWQLVLGADRSERWVGVCLLYTSDAADEEDSVDLGGRRIL